MVARWTEWTAVKPTLDPAQLKYVAKIWVSTNMARCYGRNLKGQRFLCTVPHGHWKTATVIMVNLSSHKRLVMPAVRATLDRAGCRLLLSPTYNPDLNPIELAFFELEAMLCKAVQRTIEVT